MPYPGFFHRLLNADMFVVLDHVQFLRNSKSWHHRDLIKSPQGAAWLTVSVQKAPRFTAINAIELSDSVDWRRRHINLLTQYYKPAAYFSEIFPYVAELYRHPCRTLVEFNMASIRMLLNLLDIEIDTKFSSRLMPQGKGCSLLVDILQKTDGRYYLSGTGARAYHEPAVFKAAGIEVVWQVYAPPVYPQQYDNFIPNLSMIDMLFNCGIQKSKKLLKEI